MPASTNPKANEANKPDVKADEGTGKFTGNLKRFNQFMSMSEDQLVTEGADLLRKYVRATAHLKALAEVVVALRMKYKDPAKKNIVDWGGRSEGYKAAVQRIYEEAGTGTDESPIRNALKYHVQNYVKQLAPEKDLIALGLKTTKRGAGGSTNQSGGSTNATNNGKDDKATHTRVEPAPDFIQTVTVLEDYMKDIHRLIGHVSQQTEKGITDDEKRISLVKKLEEIRKTASIIVEEAEKLAKRHQGRQTQGGQSKAS
jgi:hypothetical protein